MKSFDRNQILTVWNDNPGQEVTLENATTRITKIEYQNPALISKILMFLIRRGKINHGVFREAPVSKFYFFNAGLGTNEFFSRNHYQYFRQEKNT